MPRRHAAGHSRYTGPAASEVKITKADGTVEYKPARPETVEQKWARLGRTKPKRTKPKRRR